VAFYDANHLIFITGWDSTPIYPRGWASPPREPHSGTVLQTGCPAYPQTQLPATEYIGLSIRFSSHDCSCPLAPRKSFDILALYKSDYYYYYYYYSVKEPKAQRNSQLFINH